MQKKHRTFQIRRDQAGRDITRLMERREPRAKVHRETETRRTPMKKSSSPKIPKATRGRTILRLNEVRLQGRVTLQASPTKEQPDRYQTLSGGIDAEGGRKMRMHWVLPRVRAKENMKRRKYTHQMKNRKSILMKARKRGSLGCNLECPDFRYHHLHVHVPGTRVEKEATTRRQALLYQVTHAPRDLAKEKRKLLHCGRTINTRD